MCIIIAKYKKNRLPTKDELKTSFQNNSDGAGFMYVDNNKVVIDKGYMKEKDFIKRFDELCKQYNNFKNKSLVIHCRIGTSSGNTPENTHPYIITNKEDLLHKTYITSNVGIAHNGIISDYNPSSKTINDTQNFIINFLQPIYYHYSTFYKNKHITNAIQKITNSKFAILNKNDEIYLIGDFVKDNNLNFSNTTYKKYTYSYDWSKYNSLWDNYNYNNFDYDYKKSNKKYDNIKNLDDCIYLNKD